jgi:hypothetical protein
MDRIGTLSDADAAGVFTPVTGAAGDLLTARRYAGLPLFGLLC